MKDQIKAATRDGNKTDDKSKKAAQDCSTQCPSLNRHIVHGGILPSVHRCADAIFVLLAV